MACALEEFSGERNTWTKENDASSEEKLPGQEALVLNNLGPNFAPPLGCHKILDKPLNISQPWLSHPNMGKGLAIPRVVLRASMIKHITATPGTN